MLASWRNIIQPTLKHRSGDMDLMLVDESTSEAASSIRAEHSTAHVPYY